MTEKLEIEEFEKQMMEEAEEEKIEKRIDEEMDKEEEKKILKEAFEIMEEEDTVAYILNVFKKLHPGDKDVAKILLLSMGCQSIRNSKGIQPSITGKTGAGKTVCCEAMLHLVPTKYILGGERTSYSLSDKALFYSKDLKSGTIIFSDDVKLSEFLEGTIKRSTGAGFQRGTKHRAVVGKKLREMEIPPRITWWLTSVEASKNEQLLSRFCTVKISESKKKYEKVHEHQKKDSGLPLRPTKKVRLCREIIQLIKDKNFIVEIPEKLWNEVEWLDDKTDPRRFDLFQDLIRAFAVFNHMQRQTEDDKLLANKRDINNAMKLYNSIRGDILLDDDEKKIFDLLYQPKPPPSKVLGIIYEPDYKYQPYSVEELAGCIGKSKTTTRKILDGLMKKIPPETIHRVTVTPYGGGRMYIYGTRVSPDDLEFLAWVRWKE